MPTVSIPLTTRFSPQMGGRSSSKSDSSEEDSPTVIELRRPWDRHPNRRDSVVILCITRQYETGTDPVDQHNSHSLLTLRCVIVTVRIVE
jgi:hypothetical protein